jgi:hypothetical protein
LAAKETIFKYGIFLPRNDRDADASPESVRWHSGRQLEWLRLKDVEAFEYDWAAARLAREYPDHLRQDIGHLFYIYDYKFSGENRVRLVFDGSRQGVNTYDETYSPTVRPEFIRLFHVCSEMGWAIKHYDVPQAFLQSPVDHDIFAYPPRSNVEFPGQLLKLRLALYGAKQSSALFYKLLHTFLLSLGFTSSTMDPCFYKRHGGTGLDVLLIVHVYDMRCSGTPAALSFVHNALLTRFKITTGDGTRFLGMDTSYELSTGVLTMGMTTYIQSTMDRFQNFDLALGLPYREIVGCLLWIVLCVNGPDLVRVKDLAKRSNSSTAADYADALKVLQRIFKRRHSVIYFKRGYAGRELIPSTTRPDPVDSTVSVLATTVSSAPTIDDSSLAPASDSPSLVAHASQDDFVLHFTETHKDMDITTSPLSSCIPTLHHCRVYESVRIYVSSISLPTLTKLGLLLPFLRHSHGKPFLFCDVLKTVPGLPQSGLLSQLRLVALLTQHGYSETSTPMIFRHHTHSTAFSLVVDDFLVRYSLPPL